MTLPRIPWLAALLLLCAACGGGSSESTAREEEARFVNPDMAAPAPAPERGGDPTSTIAPPAVAPGAESGRAQAPGSPGGPPRADTAATVPAMIIRTGTATIEVDSLEPAVARLRQLAERLGGYVANTSQQTGEREVRQGTLELKIPAPRFDEALRGLNPLGEVESVSVSAQDVGEEFVDVSARVANARRLETRLVELLANRTGRLEDVLAVERELARVREEIERYEGRLRYLRSRVSLSTLTVHLHEPFPVVGDYPGANPVTTAFRDAWRNFVGFVAGFIASLGFLVPLGLILWGAWLLLRRLRWRRRSPPPPPPAAP